MGKLADLFWSLGSEYASKMTNVKAAMSEFIRVWANTWEDEAVSSGEYTSVYAVILDIDFWTTTDEIFVLAKLELTGELGDGSLEVEKVTITARVECGIRSNAGDIVLILVPTAYKVH